MVTDPKFAQADTVGFSQMVLPASMLAKGHRVGPYEILRAIGRGGVGAVYHARVAESCALPVGREVALKILRQEHLSEADLRRFTREAAYLQALSHHSITRIHDVGDYAGRPYLVMELINGQCLDALVGRDHQHPLAADHAADLVIQALEGLHVAHIAGITHRDLKPGNLMITPQGRVKILDFGMAQRVSGESRLTASGSILGTPAYMSPEQARGMREWIGAHSDIYAVGAVLYELVTGYQPYRAENSVAVLRAIIEEPLTLPSTLVTDLPSGVETIILRAMAKDPRDRYASAEAMAEDLRRFRRGQKPKAQRPPVWRPWLRAIHYYRRSLALSGLVIFVLLSLLTAVGLRSMRPVVISNPQPAEAPTTPGPEPWIKLWHHPESLGESIAAAASWNPSRYPDRTIYTPVQPDNRDRSIQVESDVRIELLVRTKPETNAAAPTESRIVFSDRGIGQGYAVVIGPQVQLERPRMGVSDPQMAVVSSAAWPWSNQPVRLLLQREGNIITISGKIERAGNSSPSASNPGNNPPNSKSPHLATSEADTIILRYTDLIPLEGADHTAIHFMVPAGNAQLKDIQISRRPRSEMVSRLELGDALRQDGQFQRAERFYREFIRDFPESSRVRDAAYRRGLCLMALGRNNEALQVFLQIAADSENHPLYSVSASFQAWQCALRLGRFSEADRYFEAIRARYDLNTLLAYASQDLLMALPQRYLDSARQEAVVDPWRASSLYASAADIADYLQQPHIYGRARLSGSDVLASLGEWDQAEQLLQNLITYPEISQQHGMASIWRLAKIERLRGNFIAAEDRYQDFLRSIDEPHHDDVLWAKLWLADLYTAMERHQDTYLLWQDLAAITDHQVGAIARNLLGPLGALPLDGPAQWVNDLAYFNAVAAALASDRDRFEEWFQAALSVSEPFEWPQLLLNDAWESEVHLMETWHRYPPRRERIEPFTGNLSGSPIVDDDMLVE